MVKGVPGRRLSWWWLDSNGGSSDNWAGQVEEIWGPIHALGGDLRFGRRVVI